MVSNTLGYSILLISAFLGSALVPHNAKAAEQPVAVVIYDGANYTGRSIQIRHNAPSLGYMNRKMTSFKVTPGYTVRFYEGENYTGGYYTKKSNARESARVAYDNKVQSIEILRDGTPTAERPPIAVTIYDNRNYSGKSLEIRYDTPSFGSMNKKLSSFIVSPGYQVRFFTEDNYQGEFYTRDSNDRDGVYAKDLDNKISSVKILKDPNAHSYGKNNNRDYYY